jgi:predicted transcriptional regulator
MASKNKIVQVGKKTHQDPQQSKNVRLEILAAAMSDARLGSRDWRVLVCLLEHSDPKGLCWPSMPQIAEKTGTPDLRYVRRSISTLEEYGYLTKNRGVGRRKQGNIYRVKAPASRVAPTPLQTSESRVDLTPLKQGRFYPGELNQREVRSRERSRSKEAGTKWTSITVSEDGDSGSFQMPAARGVH